MKTEEIMQKGIVVFLLTMVCCLLWGSAFPCVKIGYELFGINGSDTFSQIMFGGTRFFLAGIFTLIIGSTLSRKWMLPTKPALSMIGKLALLQTTLQYVLFYVGLARTTGVKASIIEASNVFIAILVASLLFRQEKLTTRKVIGCVAGFAGVVIINLNGTGLDFNMSFFGEGFILLSTVAYAFSSVLTKRYSKTQNPVMLCGYQFILGGALMIAIGFIGGGKFAHIGTKAILMLFYLALLSAIAFSLWGILLKYNSVSKVSVYGFMNPVFGVILSAILLKEQNNSVKFVQAVLALLLVCAGILIVNVTGKSKKK